MIQKNYQDLEEKINHFLNFSDDRPNRHSTDWTAGFGLQPQHLDGPFPRSCLVTRSPTTHILNIFLPKFNWKMFFFKNEWKSSDCRENGKGFRRNWIRRNAFRNADTSIAPGREKE